MELKLLKIFFYRYLTRSFSLLLLISLAFSARSETAAEPAPARILVPPIVHQDFLTYTQGKNIAEIDYFGGPGARRDVVEVILMHQALALGGFNRPLELQSMDSYKRILQMLGEGLALMSANTVWFEDLKHHQEKYFVSSSLIDNGAFEAGLYTRPDKVLDLNVSTLTDLSDLSAVSSRNWITDWRTLEALPLDKLYDAPLWYSMVKMVIAGRADFLLAPFQPSQHMALTVKGETLLPVPGVKIVLSGSRHWAVSRDYADAGDAWQALQKGLAILHKEGRVTRAYQESGTFNKEVASWTVLNPNPNPIASLTKKNVYFLRMIKHGSHSTFNFFL